MNFNTRDIKAIVPRDENGIAIVAFPAHLTESVVGWLLEGAEAILERDMPSGDQGSYGRGRDLVALARLIATSPRRKDVEVALDLADGLPSEIIAKIVENANNRGNG